MLRLCALALVFLSGSMHLLFAQSTSASLTGRVTDPSNARIAEAKVATIGTATNVSYETTTNTSGEYNLPSLSPGTYRIELEKAGFNKLIRPDVILHVQDALEIDFEMPVGPASETVTVEGGAPLVDTESTTVSTVIDRNFVDNLPLSGRSFQTLILLTPGTAVTQTAFDDQGQSGQRREKFERS
jgi:Carboxypeptidase regulatory-like domain